MVRSSENKEWVECGRIGRAVGLQGECAVLWNNGDCPVEIGGEIFVSADKSKYKPYRVAALRKQGRSSFIRFENVGDCDVARGLTNAILYLPVDQLAELPDGEYYSYQILGLDVLTEDGRLLGKVVRIFSAGENDVYEVSSDENKKDGEILIPAIADVILSVDIDSNRMVVRPLEGMLQNS